MESRRKQIFTVLLIGLLLFIVAGCGGEEPEEVAPEEEIPVEEQIPSPDESPGTEPPAEDKTKQEDQPVDGVMEDEEEMDLSKALTNPALANQTAPDSFRVRFETTKGDFVVEATREFSPAGVDRFYNLVKIGFFEDVAFFRVLDDFVVQFGIHGDPDVALAWQDATIPDEDTVASNKPGYLTYAKGGPDTRSTQFFINLVDNGPILDGKGFPPIGRVVEGMEVVGSLYSGYGEGAPMGRGPSQAKITSMGNNYLQDEFPELDYIKKAELVD